MKHALRKKLSQRGFHSGQVETTVEAFAWLGMFSDHTKTSQAKTTLDVLCPLLEKKLTYGEEERDMICLHHIFGIETAQGQQETHTSTVVAYGDPHGYTAMAKTVALPAAIGADLLLSGNSTILGLVYSAF